MHLRVFSHVSKTFSHASKVFNEHSMRGVVQSLACLQYLNLSEPFPHNSQWDLLVTQDTCDHCFRDFIFSFSNCYFQGINEAIYIQKYSTSRNKYIVDEK